VRAWDALDAYVDDMIEQRRHHLTDDLISELIRAEDGGDRLRRDELVRLAGGLLLAGTDTTRNQLASAVQVLCDHPSQWALLAENPALVPAAVEESIRHSPVAFNIPRTASTDIELGEFLIPQGTTVLANTAAANRDPAVYEDPGRFDITRQGVPPILSFGSGAHYCLGANLARLELVEALGVMTRRLHNPRRAGPAPWKPLVGVAGPATLPIEFDARPVAAKASTGAGTHAG
jgi:cytochrome P450